MIILFIGIRYLLGQFYTKINKCVTWLSFVSITVSIMSIIVVSSVMNGFEEVLKKKFFDFVPQVLVISNNKSFNPKKFPVNISKLEGIKSISPYVSSNVILQSVNSITLGEIVGINLNPKELILNYLISGNCSLLRPDYYNAIISKRLSDQLNVSLGDQIRIITTENSQVNFFSYFPRQRLFNIIGIYVTNSDIDDYQIFVNQYDLLKLINCPTTNITSWRLWLYNPMNIDNINRKFLPKNMIWKSWKETKGELFQSIYIEKSMMSFLFGLMIIVSIFSIIISLITLITEKQKEIFILQILGLTQSQVFFIFITYSFILAAFGSILGSILGIFFTKKINTIMNIISTNSNIFVPTNIHLLQVIVIISFTVLITIISTFYLSWYASSIQSSRTLMYE